MRPITVAALSKTWTVFSCSNTGIVGLNPTRGINVCVRLFCVCVVLYVGSGLATDCSPVQGVLPNVYRIKKRKSRPRSKKKGCRPIEREREGGLRPSPIGASATNWPVVPAPDDRRVLKRKSAPVPLRSPRIPHYLIWHRTRASAVRSPRLTAYVISRPHVTNKLSDYLHGSNSFLRSRQSLSYSLISQHFMKPKGSLPCSLVPVLSQINPTHTSPSCFSKIDFILDPLIPLMSGPS
jgi:hypothetical protein